MIKDNILDYWIESVSAALDEIDGISPFTDQNIKDLAENMMISAEQEGMAFGYDAIPNPQQTMIEHLKELHELRDKEYERNERIYQQSIADTHKLSINDVYIENGKVRFLTRLNKL